MAKLPERYESFPYMPATVKETLLTTLAKKPIDIFSPDAIGTHFVNTAEAEDVYDFIKQFTQPILIGLQGSRAHLNRPPLFEDLAALDTYYDKKRKDWYSLEDYKLARTYLTSGFNEGYLHGVKYPEPVVSVLVSDIDLFIIGGGKSLEGSHTGKRTNVRLDVLHLAPDFGLTFDRQYLEDDLREELAQVTPLK